MYCAYLRKSRADKEAEMRGEGETLARHEALLKETAAKMGFTISVFFREIVSGETILARPVMQELLHQVENGLWEGVFVAEVERLARGDSIDQGIICRAFCLSGTKILTPFKIYDPRNEFDQEYFEFGLFMSRREYKTINRRLQAGRYASVKEGKYVGSVPPYGYRKAKLPKEKGYTLVPDKEQALAVQNIFLWFTEGYPEKGGCLTPLSPLSIARKLDEMNIRPAHTSQWAESSIREILQNPVYIGKLRWNRRKNIKSVQKNVLISHRKRQSDYLLVKGLHPPLVSEALFQKAQNRLSQKETLRASPKRKDVQIQNPLAGILKCGVCGHTMIRRVCGGREYLVCQYGCGNKGSYYEPVEKALLAAMGHWLQAYSPCRYFPKQPASFPSPFKELLTSRQKQLEKQKKQLNQIYELFETGIYSKEEYSFRLSSVQEELSRTAASVEKLSKTLTGASEQPSLFTSRENWMDFYPYLKNAEEKNAFLKALLQKAVYTKGQEGCPRQGFLLELYPRLPKNVSSLS